MELPKLGAIIVSRERVSKKRCLENVNGAQAHHLMQQLDEMPITLSMHRRLGFHLLRFEEVVSFDELAELARMHSAIPQFAAADAIHIIEADADLSRLQIGELDILRAHYAKLQRSLDLYIVRRSGWVCSTAATCRLVEHWLDGRHSRDGQKTEVAMAAEVTDLSPLFSREEIAAVKARREFIQFSRIGGSAERVFW